MRGIALLLAGLLLYCGLGWVREIDASTHQYLVAAGAALIMTSVLALPRLRAPPPRPASAPRLRALLEWRWLALGGDASYGIYALHFPILMASAWAAWRWSLPPGLMVASGFAGSLLPAVLLFRVLEMPCIFFGRKLASRITGPHDAARAPQNGA